MLKDAFRGWLGTEVMSGVMRGHAPEFYSELYRVLLGHAAPLHDLMIEELVALRERGGRLFCLGVGGGAANAAHAVCDFRKLCGIEAYSPTDSVAELTARVNDEGWATVLVEWLRGSHLRSSDVVFIFSVGGGTPDVSACVTKAVMLAKNIGARVMGVVAMPAGTTALLGDAVVVTNLVGPLCTPVTEAAQGAVHHALVSDPRLQISRTKW